ncbi:MAG: YafY family protein [Ktedonobacterales bacterium]
MYHPTTRVLTVLELLQARVRISGPELAERLEVDQRTVRRYITMLQELGIPVETIRGRYGAYRLRPGFKLPPLMFSEDEALAVTLGLRAARRLGLGIASAADTEGALAKVERVLPAAIRERVRLVQETVTLVDDAPADVRETAPQSETVLTLGQAVRETCRVWLRYQAYDGAETERLLDPYGLVCRAGRWYVAGYCHLRQDTRVFRLDRITQIELRAETFTRPADFDSLAQVEQGIAHVPGRWQVVAELDATLAEARNALPATVAALDPLPDGTPGVLLRSWGGELGWIARTLLGLPFTVVVREPPELRDELRRLAERATRMAENK